jgi:hypothetical protein
MICAVPTAWDVLQISDNPARLPLTTIQHRLRIGENCARELRKQACERLRLQKLPEDTTPNRLEQQLMRDYHFSRTEARAASHMIQTGEIECTV